MSVNQKPQLFTIHFAGGNCYSLNFLTSFLTPYFEVVPLELPGRGKRMRESFLKDTENAVDDLLNEWTKKRNGHVPFGIYGHSMGALLGYELTKRLESQNPLFLAVSGNAGPNIERKENYHNLETQLFIGKLKKLGGIPEEVYNNDELFSFFEPILRADFELVECYKTASKINTPVYAVMGSNEMYTDSIGNWKNYTTVACKTSILEGNHFFINDQPEALTSILIKALDETLVH